MCQLRDPTNQPITVIEKLGKQFSCQRREAFVFESCNPPAVSQCASLCVCVGWPAANLSLVGPSPHATTYYPLMFFCV